MSTQVLFPTLVYQARLRLRGGRRLNARLLRECRQLRADDAAGRRWSARNYPGGYTSYNSAHRMHRLSPTFASLARELDRHVAAFARRLQLDLTARALTMTDCWVNVMGRGAVHGLHLHPLSTISGTYYVAVPEGSPGLKFEDPRLERFMASLYMTAMMQLGLMHQQGEQPRMDIIGARQTIDTLALLAEKTRGNLTSTEENFLQNSLYEVRMAYVEVTNELSRPPQPGAATGTGGR